MQRLLISAACLLTLSACGMSEREAKLKQLPGYAAANQACSSCHGMPYAGDKPAVAWAGIIERMEVKSMMAGHPKPDPATHAAIVKYFEDGSKL
jgi:cytochrome c553